MNGHEAAYLWARAKLLDDKVLAAQARGEIYHPSSNFMEIGDGVVTAHAVFMRNEEEGHELVLRLRCPIDTADYEKLLTPLATIFFGGRQFSSMPAIRVNGQIEVAYRCKDIDWTTK